MNINLCIPSLQLQDKDSEKSCYTYMEPKILLWYSNNYISYVISKIRKLNKKSEIGQMCVMTENKN